MAIERQEMPDEHRFFGQTASEFTQRLQGALRRELAAQQQAGLPVYGVDETHGVYTVLPDGRRLAGGPTPEDASATHIVR
jgi:hypothetical protein